MATMIAAQDHACTTGRGPLALLRDWLGERRARGAVLRELHQYNERDLADLGISRADFDAIAAGTFRRD